MATEMEFAGKRCAWLGKSGYHLVSRFMVKRRNTKVPPPPSECPLNHCMRLLAGAWTAHVLWYLREDERCFTELQADIRGISAKMLTNRLRELERNRIVERFSRPTSPPTVWYALTPVGRELCTALVHVVEVAQRLGPASELANAATEASRPL